MYERYDYKERKTEILVNDIWQEIKFKDICKGNTFRLFDNDEIVVGPLNTTKFIALSDAYVDNINGVLTVRI